MIAVIFLDAATPYPLARWQHRALERFADADDAAVDFAGNPIDRPAVLSAIAAIDWSSVGELRPVADRGHDEPRDDT